MNATLVHSLLDGMARVASIPKVFPAYIAFQIKQAVSALGAENDFPGVAAVGDIETVGDCRYRIIVTDANGTEHYVEVGVLNRREA